MAAAVVRAFAATAPVPGAIAVIQLHGDVLDLLASLTGRRDWAPGVLRLVNLAGIDDGLVARVAPDIAQVMPHGGPRVRQRLIRWLADNGAALERPEDVDPVRCFPEAADRFEALALGAVARAASPLAVGLLLDQPRRWRGRPVTLSRADRARSSRLDRLIVPPLVVLAGPANVGKSTLSNALLGRTMSITADVAGTTRDYTSGRIELAGLVVSWCDTPGLRESDDPVELEAQRLAGSLIDRADCLVAMRDHVSGWPRLGRDPDVRVINKVDLAADGGADDALRISARRGDGVAELVRTVRDALVPPEDLAHPGPWCFDERLPGASAMIGADPP